MTSKLLSAAALAVGLSAGSLTAQVIDTTTSWNGLSAVFPFGERNTATYGQTFVAPDDFTTLDSFSFRLRPIFLSPDYNLDFAAYVMEWDGAKATGSILYQSAAISINFASPFFNEYEFNVSLGLELDPAKQYVAFLSSSELFDNSPSWAMAGYVPNAYAGGNFVYFNNGANFDLLTESAWVSRPSHDLAFTANFSGPSAGNPIPSTPIPEPSTYGALGVALLGGLAWFRRRRRQA